MKFSFPFLLIILMFFFSCEKKPRPLMVRPLGKSNSDSIYSTVFPFDTHPRLGFAKRWRCKKIKYEIPDTIFTDKIRWKTENGFELDPNYTVPAFPLEVMMPDSVELGEGFFYLLVLKAREGVIFSRMHLEKVDNQHFRVQVFQEEVKSISKPMQEEEEVLKSFYPEKRGMLKFDFYYYDSLVISKKVLIY